MIPSYKIIFMGTPAFAGQALHALLKSSHTVIAVYTQPPKPVGRGYIIKQSVVHEIAAHHNIPVFTPKTLKDSNIQQIFKDLKADVAVVAAYGLILPQAILETPQYGCLNIHASLLPRWRGAAPIQRAILAGDQQTGITIMQMDQGLDTGTMLLKQTLPIDSILFNLEITEQLGELGAEAIIKVLNNLPHYTQNGVQQSAIDVTYAHKLTKQDGAVNWYNEAPFIERMIKALNPWPGCYFVHNNQNIKILDLSIDQRDHTHQPGTIVDEEMTVACSYGRVKLVKVQPANKRVMSGKDYMNGHHLRVGHVLT